MSSLELLVKSGLEHDTDHKWLFCFCLWLTEYSIVAAHIDSRIEQGKCFGNMAYAYSQLADMEMACDYYKHALQAAKDKGSFWLFFFVNITTHQGAKRQNNFVSIKSFQHLYSP